MKINKCLHCDEDFFYSRNKKYCSDKCYHEHFNYEHYKKKKRKNKSNEKKCIICGITFTARAKTVKYCSVCRKDVIKQQRKESHKKYMSVAKNKKKHSKRTNEFRKNNINDKIASTLRSSLKRILRYNKVSKNSSTLTLLGCSIDYFKNYMESKFAEGMSWDNMGDWHIDHIKPCASFDLTNVEQQKECFHYTNLQPLWAKENLSKNSFYEGKLYRRSRMVQGGGNSSSSSMESFGL